MLSNLISHQLLFSHCQEEVESKKVSLQIKLLLAYVCACLLVSFPPILPLTGTGIHDASCARGHKVNFNDTDLPSAPS